MLVTVKLNWSTESAHAMGVGGTAIGIVDLRGQTYLATLVTRARALGETKALHERMPSGCRAMLYKEGNERLVDEVLLNKGFATPFVLKKSYNRKDKEYCNLTVHVAPLSVARVNRLRYTEK